MKRPAAAVPNGGERAEAEHESPLQTADLVDDYSVIIADEVFIVLELLYNHSEFRTYFEKKYRSVRELIAQAALQQVSFVRKEDIHYTRKLRAKPKFSTITDYRLVPQNALIDAVIDAAELSLLPVAPPVIVDGDLWFFEDPDTHEKHTVQMRGDRTSDGTFFRVADVAVVFGDDRFLEYVRRSCAEGEHYIKFAIGDISPPRDTRGSASGPDPRPTERRRKSAEVFLTVCGLIRAVHRKEAQTPMAVKFRGWVDNLAFIAAYGTDADKAGILKSAAIVEEPKTKKRKTTLAANMLDQVSFLYLSNTGKKDSLASIYEVGVATSEEQRWLCDGSDYKFEAFGVIPKWATLDAQTALKESLESEDVHFTSPANQEISLDDNKLPVIRRVIESISHGYIGPRDAHTSVKDRPQVPEDETPAPTHQDDQASACAEAQF